MSATHPPYETYEASSKDASDSLHSVTTQDASQALWLANRTVYHDPKAGLNPIADSASFLLSVASKLKTLNDCPALSKLEKELIQEIDAFYITINHRGYSPEYTLICRYVICATLDDIINHSNFGGEQKWKPYSLLAAYDQDIEHQEKFFTIIERAVQEPARYIDLMEFLYLCLNLGYKGSYRSTEHSQFQLEQIIHHLYQHIRAYRGSFSKTLSPPIKMNKQTIKPAKKRRVSFFFSLLITACVVMTIFIGLGYLTENITNEALKPIQPIQNKLPDQLIEKP